MEMKKKKLTGVLSGLRVVDLSAGLAGAFCGHALAQIGASVLALRPNPSGGYSNPDVEHM